MNKFFSKILSRWYSYLIVIVTSIGVSCYLADLVNEPRDEEIIRIFIGSNTADNPILYKTLNEDRPDYLRKIEIRSASYSSNDFGTMYNYYGKRDVDMVILPSSMIYESVVRSYYQKIDHNYVAHYVNEPSYYDSEDHDHYGILVHSKEAEVENQIIGFDKDGKEKEDYYCFFGKGSLHIGDYSKSRYNTAFEFVRKIIDYPNEE